MDFNKKYNMYAVSDCDDEILILREDLIELLEKNPEISIKELIEVLRDDNNYSIQETYYG